MIIPIPELRERIRDSYACFCALMQDDGWFDPIHKQLCDWIQYHIQDQVNDLRANNDLEDRDVVKLGVILPRGALKSTIVTKYLPAWLSFQHPSIRNLIVCNTHTNSTSKLGDIKSIYESDEIVQACFPELLPTKSERWTNEFACVRRPKPFPQQTFEAAGVGTQKVSTHYNVLIEDDTVAPDPSDMEKDIVLPSRDRIKQGIGYHQIITSLLVPKGFRLRLVVTTRWGEDDLIAHLKEQEQGWKLFDAPAIQGATAENWWDGTRTFSMFYSFSQLEDLERQLGPYMFACLYLNSPQDASLRKFKPEWISAALRKYRSGMFQDQPFYYTIAIDPAISERDEAAETAITLVKHVTVGETKKYDVWETVIHGHLLPDELIERTLNLADEVLEDLACIIIETVAFQKALKYSMTNAMIRRYNQSLPIVEFSARIQKNARIEGTLVPQFSAQRIAINPALDEGNKEGAIAQLQGFPTKQLVDIIDCFSMHVAYHDYEGRKKIPRVKKKDDHSDFDKAVAKLRKSKSYKPESPIRFEEALSTCLGPEYDLAASMLRSGRN